MSDNETKKSDLKNSKEEALHIMQTLVDVARESFLLLDPKLVVISGNPTFYEVFKVSKEETEGVLLFELGNGQWDISELKKLLKEILPEKKVVRDYEVTHDFETIGKKTILLNARQVDSVQLIILAMEDISPRKELEEKLAKNAKGLETEVTKRTAELADKIKELESINQSMVGRELKMVELKKQIENLEKQLKNGNGNHKNA